MSNNQLKDSEIDVLVETLQSNIDEDLKTLREMPSNTLNDNPIPVEERPEVNKVLAEISVNPESGEFVFSDTSNNVNTKESDKSISDVVSDNKSFDLNNMNITEDMIKESSSIPELTDDEIKDLFNLIIDFRAGKKISFYNALPERMKQLIMNMGAASGIPIKDIKASRNMMAKNLLEQIIDDIKLDQAIVDFNKSITTELDIPNIANMYTSYRQEIIEDKMLETANKIESENPEKAELLRNIAITFKDTYEMGTMKHALEKRKNRQYIKDTKKYNKVCNAFNAKYENSSFKINDVKLLLPVLRKQFPNIDHEYLMQLVMLFCRECNLKNSNDIIDHTFMYYTIQNILMMSYITTDDNDDSSFLNILRNNLLAIIEQIKLLSDNVMSID